MAVLTSEAFSWHHLDQWQWGIVPVVALLLAGLCYAIGVRRTTTWPASRAYYFAGGLAVTFLATQSVIGVYDREYFSDHMIQHLLLIMVAAPLFALAAPLDLAYASGGATLRRWLDGRIATGLTHPLVALAAYFVFIPLTHLSNLMNLALVNDGFHEFEHVAFLIVGYLFFRAAFGRERGTTLHPGLRLVFVMTAVPVDTFTGLALVTSTSIPFSHFAAVAPAGSTHAWLLDNIHLGGAIMWIGGDALMLAWCIPITFTWVRWETVRTRQLDAVLDAQGI